MAAIGAKSAWPSLARSVVACTIFARAWESKGGGGEGGGISAVKRV